MWGFRTSIARIVSVFLQPFLMPLYSVALLFVYTNFYGMYTGQILRFLIPVFVFSFLLPSLFSIVLCKLGYIEDLTLSNRDERTFPYLIFLTSNLSLVYFFYSAGVYPWFIGLVAAPALIALVGLIINLIWKISVHMLGIGGLIGGVLSVCLSVKGVNPFHLFIILFVLAGLLGVARLFLKRSTPAQVYLGFLIGLVLAFGSVFAGVFATVISFK